MRKKIKHQKEALLIAGLAVTFTVVAFYTYSLKSVAVRVTLNVTQSLADKRSTHHHSGE